MFTIVVTVFVVVFVVWLRRRRVDPYDLKRLFDEPVPETDEAHEGLVDETSGPYCTACDHPNPAGTSRCLSCGRPF